MAGRFQPKPGTDDQIHGATLGAAANATAICAKQVGNVCSEIFVRSSNFTIDHEIDWVVRNGRPVPNPQIPVTHRRRMPRPVVATRKVGTKNPGPQFCRVKILGKKLS